MNCPGDEMKKSVMTRKRNFKEELKNILKQDKESVL